MDHGHDFSCAFLNHIFGFGFWYSIFEDRRLVIATHDNEDDGGEITIRKYKFKIFFVEAAFFIRIFEPENTNRIFEPSIKYLYIRLFGTALAMIHLIFSKNGSMWNIIIPQDVGTIPNFTSNIIF